MKKTPSNAKMADRGKKTKVKGKSSCKTSNSPTLCTICEEVITESSNNTPGEDAVFCDGTCKSWIHRRCGGLSAAQFKVVSSSNEPFLCPQCKLMQNSVEIASLKAEVVSLTKKVDDIFRQLSGTSPTETESEPEVANMKPSQIPPNKASSSNRTSNIDKKFTLVVYGVKESPEGTPRQKRIANDYENCSQIFHKVSPQVSESSIADCVRLGKFSASKNRPVLVKFARSYDVNVILSNRSKVSALEGISIKPHMSIAERRTESILLKERRALINAGHTGRQIRIKSNKLYLNSSLYGQIVNDEFIKYTTPDNNSVSHDAPATPNAVPQSIPSTSN